MKLKVEQSSKKSSKMNKKKNDFLKITEPQRPAT